MPLSKHARGNLAVGLGSQGAGKALADIIDAGTGTVSANVKARLVAGMGNRKVATTFITKVQTSAALSGIEQRHLANMVGNMGVAKEIATALAL